MSKEKDRIERLEMEVALLNRKVNKINGQKIGYDMVQPFTNTLSPGIYPNQMAQPIMDDLLNLRGRLSTQASVIIGLLENIGSIKCNSGVTISIFKGGVSVDKVLYIEQDVLNNLTIIHTHPDNTDYLTLLNEKLGGTICRISEPKFEHTICLQPNDIVGVLGLFGNFNNTKEEK